MRNNGLINAHHAQGVYTTIDKRGDTTKLYNDLQRTNEGYRCIERGTAALQSDGKNLSKLVHVVPLLREVWIILYVLLSFRVTKATLPLK